MREARDNQTPALMAAIGLHLGVFLSGVIVWPWLGKPIEVVNATAVTLVPAASAPPPPALQAHEEQQAQAPEPTPKPEPPKAAPPPPQPAPPPKPEPKPQPKPKTESLDLSSIAKLDKSSRSPSKASPSRDSLDLSSIANLDKSSRPQAARRGQAQAETALNARTDPGAMQATNDAAAAVGTRLNRIWNKSCGVEGFRDLVITVRFHLTIDGQLIGQPEIVSAPEPGNTVWVAAADRAKRAVNQAAPFTELPRQTYGQWKTFIANFDGKKACENL